MAIAQVFLLSPAYCAGRRAAILLNPKSTFDLAVRLHEGRLTLGDGFAFLSGLYFRGKIAYGRRFANLPSDRDATLVITPSRGLLSPTTPLTIDLIREFATVDVAADDVRYRAPLERDLRALEASLPAESRVVLLGSIATPKYVDALVTIVGHRLHYPSAFIGRGDMSRGGLLLRAAHSGVELDYAWLDPAVKRRGPRPPKLSPETRIPFQPRQGVR